MRRTIILAVALVVTWLVWSGSFKLLLLELGALTVILTLWLAHRMDLTRREVFSLDLLPRALGYWVWLLREIVRSNLTVARIVLSPRLPISPTMVTLRPELPGLIGQATLANSITLTPGTVTIDAHEGEFRVHSLTEQGARELRDSDMAARIARAFGDR